MSELTDSVLCGWNSSLAACAMLDLSAQLHLPPTPTPGAVMTSGRAEDAEDAEEAQAPAPAPRPCVTPPHRIKCSPVWGAVPSQREVRGPSLHPALCSQSPFPFPQSRRRHQGSPHLREVQNALPSIPSSPFNAPRSAGMTRHNLQEQSIRDYCRLYRKLPEGHPDFWGRCEGRPQPVCRRVTPCVQKQHRPAILPDRGWESGRRTRLPAHRLCFGIMQKAGR